MMLEAGAVLQSRYRVISLLGQGGMGAVYYAWDMRLSIPVALKEMLAQTGLTVETLDELRAQFQQEAKILARLSHPNLVAVTDFFEENTNAYLVMKYVEGESLDDRIKRLGALPEDEVLNIARQLLDALAYCHNQGVIHRDIKPANIIIRPDGEVVLVDFGLVKLWDPDDPKTQTVIRGVGTPQYAPPEQYGAAVGHTGPRSDLYSVGATFYYALTGKIPPAVTLRIASPEVFTAIRKAAPGISDRMADAVERAVELTRASRWADALTMAQALGLSIRASKHGSPGLEHENRETETVRMSGGDVPVKEARKRFSLWMMGVVGIVILGVGTVVALRIAGIIALPGMTSPTPTATQVFEAATATQLPQASPTASSTPSATPDPTETTAPRLKVTETPTPSPKRTATSTLTSTDTPMPETDTPTYTPTSSPTADVTPTPELPEPSPTSEPVMTGALIGFETWGTWRRGDQPYGEFVQTQAQVKEGSYAAKLTYDFPSSGEDYVVFVQSRSISGQPNQFAAWVYGDGSGHFLNLWIQDAQDEIWSVNLGRVGIAGWQRMTGSLAPGLDWPNGRISGPDNGAVDYPVRFYALVLDRPSTGALQGEIFLDEIEAWQGEVPSNDS